MCEIRNFKPRKYWSPVIQIIVAQQKIHLTYEDNNVNSELEAKKILISIKDTESVKVVQVKSQKFRIKKPSPMNTNDLLIMASKKYGFNSNQTKSIAEELYSKGLISYPRTQGRKYSVKTEIQ